MKEERSNIFVFDSFAILSFLENEKGAWKVHALLSKAKKGKIKGLFCILNLGEVVYIIEREQGLNIAHRAIATLEQLPLEIIEVDRDLTLQAAHIKANYHLSYADAFVVALAVIQRGYVVTGDSEFKSVEKLVPIEWIHR